MTSSLGQHNYRKRKEESVTSNDELYGLVLMGGQSSRMGTDKSVLNYHGKPQVEYLFDLLQSKLSKAFVSVRKGQSVGFTEHVIEDSLDTNGPINGIISAMRAHPDKSWLVLAVDLPFVTELTIDQLIKNRDQTALGTSLATQETGLPEPLIAIWEAHARPVLEEFHIEQDMRCPRKFMMNHEVHLAHPQDDQELYNANNPDEYEFAKSLIQ
ncbi:NTP transferase domain-containing protein [Ekhidna sp.]|uniref:molybdenum cofactor guanylyltransferase n=1 Tax=Ekhidna sp. TaxID=2608089 RepID=UPI003297CD73